MRQKPQPLNLNDLSTRELEVLGYIALGWSNQQIAEKLIISLNTVRWHNKQIYGKLGVESRTLAIARARELGLLTKQSPAVPAQTNTLPLASTPFVGRQLELVALHNLLNQPECRLLTLLGLGGIGKTRLGLQLAVERTGHYGDGVFFVPLAPVSSVEFISQAIINALGMQSQPQGDLTDQLLHYLRDKHLLLIVDNFEHLLAGTPLLRSILDVAAKVAIVVTSHEKLGLPSEVVYEVGGLQTDCASNLDHVPDAVELFRLCAERSTSNFVATTDDLGGIAEICQLLDGMPLGVELAASWARVLSISEIASEIRASLDFLATTMADVPERHRSLRAVFEQSWMRLSKQERSALKQLSMFQGGFTRQAAQEVAGASLVTLASLVDRSLIRLEMSGRYIMHEVIRQYAGNYLKASDGDADHARDEHCAFYMRFLDQHVENLKIGQFGAALEEINADLDNIRQAMHFAVDQQQWTALAQGCEGWCFAWLYLGLLQEGERFARYAITTFDREKPPISPTASFIHAFFHLALAWFLHRQGDYLGAHQQMDYALPVFRELGDPKWIAAGLHMLARNYSRRGNRAEELTAVLDGLEHAWQSSEAWLRLDLTSDLAHLYTVLGNYDLAQTHIDQAQTMPGAAEGEWGWLYVSYNAMYVAFNREEYQTARQIAERILSISEDLWFRALASGALAEIALAEQDTVRARALYNQVLAQSIEIGEQWGELRGLTGLALTSLAEDDLAAAHSGFRTVLEKLAANQAEEPALNALYGIAVLMFREKQLATSAQLLGLIRKHPACSAKQIKDAENLIARLHAEMPSEALAQTLLRGEQSTLAQMVSNLTDHFNRK